MKIYKFSINMSIDQKYMFKTGKYALKTSQFKYTCNIQLKEN